jgi:hypothetical protein
MNSEILCFNTPPLFDTVNCGHPQSKSLITVKLQVLAALFLKTKRFEPGFILLAMSE